jgi:hypothetical protein
MCREMRILNSRLERNDDDNDDDECWSKIISSGARYERKSVGSRGWRVGAASMGAPFLDTNIGNCALGRRCTYTTIFCICSREECPQQPFPVVYPHSNVSGDSKTMYSFIYLSYYSPLYFFFFFARCRNFFTHHVRKYSCPF